jgi:hypothetical protein
MNASPGIPRRRLWALVSAAAGIALVFAVATRADSVGPAVDLGPVKVANDTADVSGQVDQSRVDADLTINGQQVGVDSSGKFDASVNVKGQTAIAISTADQAAGQTLTTTIPLSLRGSDGVIPTTVLDHLEAAGISVTIPPGGLVSVDGGPVTINGSVVDPGQLRSLSVNGSNVMGRMGPNGGFSKETPDGSSEATIEATDRQGVTQRATVGIRSISTTIRTKRGISVSSAGALGLRIASVHYALRGVQAKKQLSMTVWVKDRRGYLVRDAIVSVRGKRGGTLRPSDYVKLSNRFGQATFTVRPRVARFGQRLFLVARAKTPRAVALKTTSVLLPELR